MPLLHFYRFLFYAAIFICLASFTRLTGLLLCPPLMRTCKEFIAMAIDKNPHSSSPLYFVLIVSGQQAGTECWESFLKRFYGVCVIPHWPTRFHTSTGCFGCQTHVLCGCSTQTNIELTLTTLVHTFLSRCIPVGPYIGRYCGQNTPGRIISYTGILALTINTDSAIAKEGFSANFTVIERTVPEGELAYKEKISARWGWRENRSSGRPITQAKYVYCGWNRNHITTHKELFSIRFLGLLVESELKQGNYMN